jgi:glycosyltransferase involved in cell wall biosynthesis
MKICFWGNIARALEGRTSGGGELQIALLAKALVRSGHEVVVLDYMIDEGYTTADGIKVFPVDGWNKGIRMLRTFTHRLPLLYRALKEVKADVYYCRIRDARHWICYKAARKVGAKFILALAEDLDVTSFSMRWKYYYLTNIRTSWDVVNGVLCEIVYPFLVKHADYVFTQHSGQSQILAERGIEPTLFPNLLDLSQIPKITNPEHDYFVFVGWLDNRKGIRELYEIIERSPDSIFKIIGPPRDKTGRLYYEKMKSLKNVSLLGELSHNEALHYIANSKALINTSPMEGFPNIFIEAWACGKPVLSLNVDPGSAIENEDLGAFAHGNLERLIDAMKVDKNSDEFASRARSFVEKHHALNNLKMDEIKSIFDVLSKGRRVRDSIMVE